MKSATKGALAAVGVGSLLLGGAGTMAYWSDSETIAGGDIASGKLSLTQETGQVCGAWQIKHGSGTATTYTAGTDLVVPGDVLTRTCDYTIKAAGKNLAATLTLATPTFGTSNALSTALSAASASYKLNGSPVTSPVAVTTAQNDAVLNVVVSVPFDSTVTGTTAQNLSTTLNDLTVTLQQSTAS